jgi:uncharacterized membrane protein
MRAARSSLDLLAAVALALAGLAAALVPLATWLRVVLLLPLVLAAGGYAILAALFPDERLTPAERVVYSVALSVTATALGGIVVQLVLGLDRTAWAVLLAAITVAAAALALWRRGALALAALNAGEARQRPRLSFSGVLSALMIAGAVAIAAVAVSISSAGARRELDSHQFTALWARPVERVAGPGQAVAIGVDSHQGETVRYRLLVGQPGVPASRRLLKIPDGGRFRLRVPVAPIGVARPVTVSLLRGDAVFRRVRLESGRTP